jgi:hypothetical protein
MESLLELYELISERTFLPVALALVLVLVLTVGTGAVRNRLPRSLCLPGLALLGVALCFGLGATGGGEVLFNGQIL